MTDEQHDLIEQLRKDGHAVVIFNADELRGANPDKVEELMCVHGWDVIDSLAKYPDPDYCEDEEEDDDA